MKRWLNSLRPDVRADLAGLQQTCGEVKHHFLLTLADQLIREPQSVTAPLSVMLNPYRPLPLAGWCSASLLPMLNVPCRTTGAWISAGMFCLSLSGRFLPDCVRANRAFRGAG
jgi:hypothetical protein